MAHSNDKSLSLGTPEQAATNSLPSDHRNQQPVRLVFIDIRIGSPPQGKASKCRPPLERLLGYPHIHSFARRRVPIRPCRMYRLP